MNWGLYSFVSRSEQRVKIIRMLERPVRPTQIARETKLNKSHVSRTLKEFTDKGIARCLTPDERVGRYYQLTDEGRSLMKRINDERK